MSTKVSATANERTKTIFFLVVGACFLTVLYTDERFLVNRHEPQWQHIAPFKWWLLVHGTAGLAALLAGPLDSGF